jgi:hypothetical protein
MISQQSMYDNMKRGEAPSLPIPDEIRDKIKNDIKLEELDRKIEGLKEQVKNKVPGARNRLNRAQSSRQAQKTVVDALPKPKTVDEEIETIEQNLRPNGQLKKGFRSLKDYKRLVDLSRISNKARNLLYDMNLSHEKTLRNLYDELRHTMIADALEKDMFAKSVIDHLNDGHPPVTTEDVKAYADHIASKNVEPIPEELPDVEPQTMDQIKENFFDDDTVEDLLDALPDEEIKADYERVTKDLSNMESYKDMARGITKCLLGGG